MSTKSCAKSDTKTGRIMCRIERPRTRWEMNGGLGGGGVRVKEILYVYIF